MEGIKMKIVGKQNEAVVFAKVIEEEAIQQIKDRNYMMKFQGRLGEKEKYTGRILAVGIAYNKKDKEHECKVEILRGRQIQRD